MSGSGNHPEPGFSNAPPLKPGEGAGTVRTSVPQLPQRDASADAEDAKPAPDPAVTPAASKAKRVAKSKRR